MTRAATQIQRWFRMLPRRHRDLFMLYVKPKIAQISSKVFLVKLEDYFSMLNEGRSKSIFPS